MSTRKRHPPRGPGDTLVVAASADG